MMFPIDPNNNYWLVEDHPDLVFFSGLPGYIPLNDHDYVAWTETGNIANSTPTDGELADILVRGCVAGNTILAADPKDWTKLTQPMILAIIQTAGVNITHVVKTELSAIYETGGDGLSSMLNTAQYISTFNAFPNGVLELQWQARYKTVLFTTTQDFLDIARGIGDYMFDWRSWTTGEAPSFGKTSIPKTLQKARKKKPVVIKIDNEN